MRKVLSAVYLLVVVTILLLAQTNGLGPNVTLMPGSSVTNELRFRELSANGQNYIGFKAPTTISANVDLIWPAGVPATGDVLNHSGSNQLAWGSVVSLIGAKTITQAMLGDNIVGAGQMVNNSVGATQLANGAVNTTQLADGGVTPVKTSAALYTQQFSFYIHDEATDIAAGFALPFIYMNETRSIHLTGMSCYAIPLTTATVSVRGGATVWSGLTCNGQTTAANTVLSPGASLDFTVATAAAGLRDLNVTIKYTID